MRISDVSSYVCPSALSMPRAYLENMRESRARGGRIPRTLSRDEMENRLDALIRRSGEGALNKLRDDARALAPKLELEKEFEELNDLIGAFLGTRSEERRVGKECVSTCSSRG